MLTSNVALLNIAYIFRKTNKRLTCFAELSNPFLVFCLSRSLSTSCNPKHFSQDFILCYCGWNSLCRLRQKKRSFIIHTPFRFSFFCIHLPRSRVLLSPTLDGLALPAREVSTRTVGCAQRGHCWLLGSASANTRVTR